MAQWYRWTPGRRKKAILLTWLYHKVQGTHQRNSTGTRRVMLFTNVTNSETIAKIRLFVRKDFITFCYKDAGFKIYGGMCTVSELYNFHTSVWTHWASIMSLDQC